jgi:hypothetical protein
MYDKNIVPHMSTVPNQYKHNSINRFQMSTDAYPREQDV